MPTYRFGVPPKLIMALGLGTLLNPLNSSMIAVALVRLQDEFQVGVATSSWLVSTFYVTAAVAQPLMGRLVDRFGARRMFLTGLLVVLVVSVLTPFCPSFWWLVALRAAQAAGTSAAFPSAVVLIRGSIEEGSNPAAGLGAISVTNSASAALGPVIGGVLVTVWGWQAVFLVNVPLALVGLVIAWRVLPRVAPPAERVPFARIVRSLDLAGVALFTVTMTSLLLLLLSFADEPRWWCLPVFLVAATGFVLRERSAAEPFIDLRGLAGNRALSGVLAQQGSINLAFYCVFFGMPMWLEGVRGLDPGVVGLLILPVTAVSTLVTPLSARLIGRRGPRVALVTGGAVLVGSSLLLQLMGDTTPIAMFVVFALLLGIPNGFNNLGLQTSLYQAAPAAQTGTASGLFQTFRYLGAIMSTTVLGLVFENDLSSRGLHRVGLVMTAAAVVVLTLSLIRRRPGSVTPS